MIRIKSMMKILLAHTWAAPYKLFEATLLWYKIISGLQNDDLIISTYYSLILASSRLIFYSLVNITFNSLFIKRS